MKQLKNLSKEANELRESFQHKVVVPAIVGRKRIGYKGQIYLLLPSFDKRLSLYKGVSRETYTELREYLRCVQSQRRFNGPVFTNQLQTVKSFCEQDLSICYSRVWHNGTTVYSGPHWKAQALALRNKKEEFGFTSYAHDYNFGSHHHKAIETADKFLVGIYEKAIVKIISKQHANRKQA